MLGDQVRVCGDQLGEGEQSHVFQVRVADDEEAAELSDADGGEVVAVGGVDDAGEEPAGDQTRDAFVEERHGGGRADQVCDWGNELFDEAGFEGGECCELGGRGGGQWEYERRGYSGCILVL